MTSIPFTYDPDRFLTEEEAGEVTKRIYDALGLNVARMLGDYGAQDLIRTMPIKKACQDAREKMGITIKEVSLRLKIPQYYLKGAEGVTGGVLESGVLVQYVEFLGIKDYFDKWLESNRDVFERMEQKSATRRKKVKIGR